MNDGIATKNSEEKFYTNIYHLGGQLLSDECTTSDSMWLISESPNQDNYKDPYKGIRGTKHEPREVDEEK